MPHLADNGCRVVGLLLNKNKMQNISNDRKQRTHRYKISGTQISVSATFVLDYNYDTVTTRSAKILFWWRA